MTRPTAPLIAALLVACAACQPAATAPNADPHAARIASIESDVQRALVITGEDPAAQTIADRMAALGVPGLSVAFIADGRIAWTRAYGVADTVTGAAVTSETLFQAASISKPVAAMAALSLVQDGVLDLDADVNGYLSQWQVPEHRWSAASPVTLRGLVTHTAGLTVHGFPGYGLDEVIPDTAGVLSGTGNTPAVFVDTEPRTLWRYSGGGYTVMQQLVSETLGERFPAIMQARVLEPLAMASSTYEQPLPTPLHSRAATGYRGDGEAVDGRFHTYPEMAAAGLWTTPSDLARFAIALQQARSGAPHPVLSATLVDQMLTADEFGHGLGPGIEHDGAFFGHGGANEGFRCTLLAQMDGGEGVAIMTNSDVGGVLAREVLLSVAREYGWSQVQPTVRTVIELSADALARYAGVYQSPGAPGNVRVRADAGALVLEPEWSPEPMRVQPESPTDFFSREGLSVAFRFAGDRVVGFGAQGREFTRVK